MHSLLTKNGIYAITDCENFDESEFINLTRSIVSAGIQLLQFRAKNLNKDKQLRIANQLKLFCTETTIPLIINDDIDLALAANADGVHLGKNDTSLANARKRLKNKIIGISCYNSIERGIQAEQEGADYIAFGSFYPSKTKPNAVQANLDLLVQAKKNINIPIVAIGGINTKNGVDLIKAGANYLAVISGIYSTADPLASTIEYVKLYE